MEYLTDEQYDCEDCKHWDLNGSEFPCTDCVVMGNDKPTKFKRNKKAATAIQSTPKGNGIDITSLVQYDLGERARIGEKKYGERLQPFNGRDALVDLYQELLDACMYIRQLLEEEER